MGVMRAWARAAADPRRRRRAALAALLAAAALVGAGGALPAVGLTSRADFPHATPADLAHLLADFSTQPHAGSWRVEEERGNYSAWSYRVTFSCGARCAGAARVSHAARATGVAVAPAHGAASAHVVSLTLRACTRLPLLPWPEFCEEVEVDARVEARAGGGSSLAEAARARCWLPRALSGACARDLRAHRERHLEMLRARLPRVP